VADELSSESAKESLVRAVRQHLESLTRAGLDRVPAPRRSNAASESAEVSVGGSIVPFAGESERETTAAVDAGDTIGFHEPTRPAPPIVAVPSTGTPTAPAVAHVLPPPSLAALFGSSEFQNPPIPACDRPGRLDELAREVSVCVRCPHLAETRTQTVFGVGSPAARLMFVGEAPGADEDRLGEPFVGRAGQLLTDIITKGMGLARDQVYIANILKCRPPENRNPSNDEMENCFSYLEQQIEIIRPEFLCLLGRIAVQAILNTTHSMAKMRGKWHRYRGIRTIVTYHPAYLLRNPAAKKDTWEDLQMLMKEMGLVRPSKQ
jgi:uracil-DNA glycosylase family 4